MAFSRIDLRLNPPSLLFVALPQAVRENSLGLKCRDYRADLYLIYAVTSLIGGGLNVHARDWTSRSASMIPEQVQMAGDAFHRWLVTL